MEIAARAILKGDTVNIELKNIKYASFASHETDCFSATVYIDGKKAGTVENDGQGGSNNYHPWTVYESLAAHCETIPPDMAGNKVSPDEIIGNLLNAWFIKKDRQKLCKGNTVFRIPGKTYNEGEWSQIKQPFDMTVKLFLIGRYGPAVDILNERI